MKVLTIERSKWRRGGNNRALVDQFGSTQLLNDKGFMCCLGFDALACGLAPDDIRERLWPSSVINRKGSRIAPDSDYARTRTVVTPNGWIDDALATQPAMTHNDEPFLPDAKREALIREDLKALGWDDVIFVD